MNADSTPVLREPGKVFQTLLELNLARRETVCVFSENTRDVKGLQVLRDTISGIMFIDGNYVGDDEYRSGAYRDKATSRGPAMSLGYEDRADAQRRISAFLPHIVGKRICDFGCGAGSFLREARPMASEAMGIELQDSYREQLNEEGIACRERLAQLNRELDTFFLFHCFEHLPDPMQTLREIREKLVPEGEGRIIVEVPHARDFLMDVLTLREFIEFTLWSQHLILHTRESLRVFLREAGYKNIVVTGVQRFGLANHLGWLRGRRPGGHKTNLSIMENDVLKTAYSDALARIDANDTLIAMATT